MVFPSQRGGLPPAARHVQAVSGKRNAVEPARRFRGNLPRDYVFKDPFWIALEGIAKSGAGRCLETDDLTFVDRKIGKCRRQLLLVRAVTVHVDPKKKTDTTTEQTKNNNNLTQSARDQTAVLRPTPNVTARAKPTSEAAGAAAVGDEFVAQDCQWEFVLGGLDRQVRGPRDVHAHGVLAILIMLGSRGSYKGLVIDEIF